MAEDRTPIVAFTSDRTPASALAAQLARNGIAVSGGLHCAPLAHRTLGTLEGGVVRISVGPATTDDEVQEAIDGLRRCLLRDGSA